MEYLKKDLHKIYEYKCALNIVPKPADIKNL